MLISPYTYIYFFVKEFILSNVYISVNTIFECLYMFFGWERGHQLNTYTTGGGMEERSSKIRTTAYRGRGCHMPRIRKHLHYSFSCFWQHFCLTVFCFICRNLTLPLSKKDVFVRNIYFSPTKSVSVVMK